MSTTQSFFPDQEMTYILSTSDEYEQYTKENASTIPNAEAGEGCNNLTCPLATWLNAIYGELGVWQVEHKDIRCWDRSPLARNPVRLFHIPHTKWSLEYINKLDRYERRITWHIAYDLLQEVKGEL